MVCGSIEPPNTGGFEWLTERIRLIAEYKAAGNKSAYAKLVVNWIEPTESRPERSIHLHIESALGTYFGDRPPAAESTTEEIREVLEKCGVRPIRGIACARFVIPKKKLRKSSLVKALLRFQTRSQGLEVALTGGRFNIRSEHLASVNWREDFRDDSLVIVADVDGLVNETSDELLLNRVSDTLRPAFDATVGGPRRRGSPSSPDPESQDEST